MEIEGFEIETAIGDGGFEQTLSLQKDGDE